jgi:hypothetical protein
MDTSQKQARNNRRFLYLGASRSICIGAYEALLSTVLFNRHWCTLQPTLGRSTIEIPPPETGLESALQSDTTSYLNKLIMLAASKTSFHFCEHIWRSLYITAFVFPWPWHRLYKAFSLAYCEAFFLVCFCSWIEMELQALHLLFLSL